MRTDEAHWSSTHQGNWIEVKEDPSLRVSSSCIDPPMFVLRERRCFGSASTILSSLHTSLFGSPHVSVCICTSACPSMSKFASCRNIGMCRVACGTLSVVNLGTCHDPTSPVRRCRHFSGVEDVVRVIAQRQVRQNEKRTWVGWQYFTSKSPTSLVVGVKFRWSTAGLDQTVGEVALEDVSEPCRKSLALWDVRRTSSPGPCAALPSFGGLTCFRHTPRTSLSVGSSDWPTSSTRETCRQH